MAHRARKRFGQHFLVPVWADKVLHAIAPAATDTFLEIGPGTGALTRPLAAAAGRVVAFEIDRDLAAALRADAPPNVTIDEGDFLDVTVPHLQKLIGAAGAPAAGVRVAGNLPYNVAAPILFRLCEFFNAGVALPDATLMLQREVADRLTAKPGTRDYGILTILIGRSARVTPLLALPPGAFRPAPKVHSALLRLSFHAPDPPAADETLLVQIVRAVFTRRRKTLANALLALGTATALPKGLPDPAAVLAASGIDGRRRPETLAPPEFVRLADAYWAAGGPALPPGARAVL